MISDLGKSKAHWGAACAVTALLLVLDISAIALKSRKSASEPAIQDVFLKEKPQFTPDLGQLLSLVPPTDYIAPPPELHGPQYRTADWLRAQGGLAWTLLVFQAADEEMVKEYLAKRPDKEQFAYVAQRTETGTVYVVLFGNFVTRELALGQAETMDFGLTEGLPAPSKFTDFIARVPVLEPAIDAPPPPRYGDVPEPVTEPVPGDPGEGLVPENEPGAGTTESMRQDNFDPFATETVKPEPK